MRPLFRRVFHRRFVTRALFVFACLATLVVAFYLFEHWRGKRAWESYRSTAEQSGLKLDIAAYLPPDIPDSENYASVPLIAEFLKQSDSESRGDELFSFPETPGTPRPKRNLSEPNAFNAVEWRDYLIKCGWIETATADPARDILRALERHRTALAAFHEAGLRPKAKFPLKWEDGFSMRLPHLPNLQRGANLLALRASAHLQLGETDAALSDLRDILHIARALEQQPIMICALVRIAVIGHCFPPLIQGLANGQWSDDQLRTIGADLNRIPLLESWVYALNGERAIVNMELLKISERPSRETALIYGLADGATQVPLGARLLASTFPHGWIYDNAVAINRLFDDRAARIDLKNQTIREGLSSDRMLINMIGNSWYSHLRYPFAFAVFPAFEILESRHLFTVALIREIQMACAIERFRLKHHRLPANLDELIPDFESAIPNDPADGKRLRYRAAEDGSYILWSIGIDRKDDGGLDDAKKDPIEKPDWILSMPKPPTPKS